MTGIEPKFALYSEILPSKGEGILRKLVTTGKGTVASRGRQGRGSRLKFLRVKNERVWEKIPDETGPLGINSQVVFA